jgi:hypothetical protein
LKVPKDVLVKTRSEVERYRRVRASLESEILEHGEVLYKRDAIVSIAHFEAQIEEG